MVGVIIRCEEVVLEVGLLEVLVGKNAFSHFFTDYFFIFYAYDYLYVYGLIFIFYGQVPKP